MFHKLYLFIEKNARYLLLPIVLVFWSFAARWYFYLDPNWIIALWDFFELPNYSDISRYSYAMYDHLWQWKGNLLALSNWYYGFLEWFYSFDLIYSHRHFYYVILFFLAEALLMLSLFRISSGKFGSIELIVVLLLVFNPLTLTFFRYSWWFTHYVLHYFFVSFYVISFLLIYENVGSTSIKKIVLLWLVTGLLWLYTITNIAFLLTIWLAILLLSIWLIVKSKDLMSIWKIVIFNLTISLLLIPFVYYSYVIQSEYLDLVRNSSAFGWDVIWFIRVYSSSILNLFYLNINWYGSNLNPFSIAIFWIVVISILFVKNFNKVLLITIFIFLILGVRIQEPFESINLAIYDSFLGSFIRSADKVFFVYICLVIFLLYGLLKKLKIRVLSIFFYFLLLSISWLILTYPLTEDRIHDQKWVDLYVRIPTEYHLLEKYLDNSDRIVSLPYSVTASPWWSDHPDWHHRWSTVLSELSPAEWISANNADYSWDNNYFRFKNCIDDWDILFKDLIEFHATHFIIHFDIDNQYIKCSNTLEYLASNDSRFKKIEDNKYYKLYGVNHTYSEIVEKVNPALHRITVSWESREFIHPYSYSKNWMVTWEKEVHKELASWYATKYYFKNPSKIMEIEYTPQQLLNYIFYIRTKLLFFIFFITVINISIFIFNGHKKKL